MTKRAPILLAVLASTAPLATPSAAEPTLSWAESTRSPLPAPAPDARDAPLLALCPAGDAALHAVAARLAARALPSRDMESIAYALRVAGEPHVWPRAWTLSGKGLDRNTAATRMRAWLASFGDAGRRRCGVASATDGDGTNVYAAVAVDAQADLARVPMRVHAGAWVSIDATILVPATAAKVVVLGPTGAPRTVPTSFDGGRVRARFAADREGTWLAQVLLDGATGPRPVLETFVFADVAPPASQPIAAAPGERAGDGVTDAADALARMVTVAREAEGLAPLARDEALDRVARAHAERMMAAQKVGHDVGDGDPRRRIEEAGIVARESGENVAHAATVALAHRALWASPSHRGNLLHARFDRIGIGIVPDPDGSVWVTESFVRAR